MLMLESYLPDARRSTRVTDKIKNLHAEGFDQDLSSGPDPHLVRQPPPGAGHVAERPMKLRRKPTSRANCEA